MNVNNVFSRNLISFALATGQLLGAPAAAPNSASPTNVPKTASVTARKGSGRPKPKFKPYNPIDPAGTVDLDKEPHIAILVEDSIVRTISESEGFKPDELRTAASFSKLITMECLLDKDPGLDQGNDRERAEQILVKSNNWVTEATALDLAARHTHAAVLDMLGKKENDLKIAGSFDVKTPSGEPTIWGGPRRDSRASPNAVMAVMMDVSRRLTGIDDFYYRITAAEKPTHILEYPLEGQGDPADSKTRLRIKTGTAEDDYRSMAAYLSETDNAGNKREYGFYHPNFAGDSRRPSSTMAALIKQVLEKDGYTHDPRFMQRLDDVAWGRVTSVEDAVHLAAHKTVRQQTKIVALAVRTDLHMAGATHPARAMTNRHRARQNMHKAHS